MEAIFAFHLGDIIDIIEQHINAFKGFFIYKKFLAKIVSRVI